MIARDNLRKCWTLAWAAAIGLQLGFGALSARADILGLWRLDELSGTVAPNSVARGATGTLYNGPTWTTDSQRGQVLLFDGANDYVTAGSVPALAQQEDFTWAFWARSEQTPDSRVMLGNRFGAGGDNYWIKFTPAKFEYKGAVHYNLDYADLAANQWIHHTIVKSGAMLTYYRDGVASGTASAPTDMPSALPFYFGGDAAGERWQGRIDDVAIFNEALGAAQVQQVMAGDFSQFDASRPSKLLDYFSGTTVDAFKWDVVNRGLGGTADGGYNAPTVASGTLTLGGTTTVDGWAGKTLSSKDVFQTPDHGEIQFDVNRVSLAGTGSAYRSSTWMFQDDSHFVQLSQAVNEAGWQFNAGNNNPTGPGVNLAFADSFDADLGNHKMTLVHDGAYVKMFLDNRYLGSQAANFNNFKVMLTGQAAQATDSVSAVFDNVKVSTRLRPDLYDDFNSGSIDPGKWTVVLKGLESSGSFTGDLTASVKDGELIFGNPTGDSPGSTGRQYWYGVTLRSTRMFDPDVATTFVAERDGMVRGGTAITADRSGVWLWADDNHFLFFGQNWGETGWQYNYADGSRTSASIGGGVNIAAFDSLDADGGRHEMKLGFRPTAGGVAIDLYLDGVLGATQPFSNWGNLDYYFMLSGMPRASTDAVYAAFDNVQFIVPEPATWLLLLVGAALVCYRRSSPTVAGLLAVLRAKP
jgi:hypothetical protein